MTEVQSKDRPTANLPSPSVDVTVLVEATLPADFDPDELDRLVHFVLERERQSGDWSVAVVLTDDERLRALHRDFMGLDEPTDVMTFPLDGGVPGQSEERGGDVVVSVERAAEQAASFGLTPAQETRFLVVHGLLHLSGWRDEDDEQRTRMLDRQRELLAEFAAAGVYGRMACALVDRSTVAGLRSIALRKRTVGRMARRGGLTPRTRSPGARAAARRPRAARPGAGPRRRRREAGTTERQ
jgi:probable rRNA maturation factor